MRRGRLRKRNGEEAIEQGIARAVIPVRVIRLALLAFLLAGLMSADGYRLACQRLRTDCARGRSADAKDAQAAAFSGSADAKDELASEMTALAQPIGVGSLRQLIELDLGRANSARPV